MRTKRFIYLGVLIAAMIMAACSPKATSEPTATSLPPTAAPTATKAVVVPEVSGEKVAMGFTEDGAPYRGDPNASVTLLEYSDYQ